MEPTNPTAVPDLATLAGTIVTAPNTPAEFAAAIRGALSSSVQGYLDAGRYLAGAKEAVGKGVVWERWLRDSVDNMSQSTASKLMAIAKYPPFQDHSNSNDLPLSVEALYALTHLPVEKFAQAKEHFIGRNMTLADAKDLVGHRVQRIIEAKKAEEAEVRAAEFEQENVLDQIEVESGGETLNFPKLLEGVVEEEPVEDLEDPYAMEAAPPEVASEEVTSEEVKEFEVEVDCSDEAWEQFEAECARRGTSTADMLGELVRRYAQAPPAHKVEVTTTDSDGVVKTTTIEPSFICPDCGFVWTHNCLGRA